jgi:hypothetical protein
MGFSSVRPYLGVMIAWPRVRALLVVTAFVAVAAPLSAQHARQTVTFRIDAINEIGVQGSPSLTMVSAPAGSGPTSVTASGNSWSVTTNENNTRVTASLSEDMPPGVTLSLTLGAPTGAVSRGPQPLSRTSVDLVTNLSRVAVSGLPLVYQLDAAPTAGVVVAGTRTVVFTITAGM